MSTINLDPLPEYAESLVHEPQRLTSQSNILSQTYQTHWQLGSKFSSTYGNWFGPFKSLSLYTSDPVTHLAVGLVMTGPTANTTSKSNLSQPIPIHLNPSSLLSQVHQNVIRLISIISAPPLSTAVTTPVNLPAPPPPLYSCLCSVSSSLKENEWISLIIVLLKLSLSYTFLLIL